MMGRIHHLLQGDLEHVSEAVTGESVGGFSADEVVAGIRDDRLSTDHAWLRFTELASKHGWRSIACASFVKGLAKRAAG